jgi:hypothetical protein
MRLRPSNILRTTKNLLDQKNLKSSKSSRVMSLLRPLVLITINNNIQLKCCHIQGSRNDIGDSISRFQ